MTIDDEGYFEIKGNPKYIYIVMMRTRVVLISIFSKYLFLACIIPIRYSIVRRQFRNISGVKEETKLLDYQTQQMKLFPIVATATLQLAVSEYLNNLFE